MSAPPKTVFIGSSSEGKRYAQAVSDVIGGLDGFDVLPWWTAFPAQATFIESLLSATGRVEAAVFVATPDDYRTMRNRADWIIRDNVLYEYGLFSGKLGRSRTVLAVVGGAVGPTDLEGVNYIRLPEKREEEDWVHYRTNFIDRNIRDWLEKQFQTASDPFAELPLHNYKGPRSEVSVIQQGHFRTLAARTYNARYLVLRGRDILSPDGEIDFLREHGCTGVSVRLLMVDFDSMTAETFDRIRENMDLRWDNDLATERQLANERLNWGKALSKEINFRCRLLSDIPEVKLRLYDGCGFFTFYRKDVGSEGQVKRRPVFYVADDAPGKRSPLLVTFEHLYDRLWDMGRPVP